MIVTFALFDLIADYGVLPRSVDHYFERMAEVVEMLITFVGLVYAMMHLAMRREHSHRSSAP
jgi:hypothetical protein